MVNIIPVPVGRATKIIRSRGEVMEILFAQTDSLVAGKPVIQINFQFTKPSSANSGLSL